MLNFSVHERGALPEDPSGETSAFGAQPAGIPAAVVSGSIAGILAERIRSPIFPSLGVRTNSAGR
jgi:hypothetical protein